MQKAKTGSWAGSSSKNGIALEIKSHTTCLFPKNWPMRNSHKKVDSTNYLSIFLTLAIGKNKSLVIGQSSIQRGDSMR
jgi:hypothetical protein